jgi:RNA polymerase sigma factor (sigma-70 family)
MVIMAHTALAALLHYLRSLHNAARGELSDRELLRQYVANHDEAAFTALLHRHAPLVWSVCRRLLDNEQDAEDAFQAVFLVLLRKATSLRVGPSLANWLHAVATRIALKSRVTILRRLHHEKRAVMSELSDPYAAVEGRDLRAVLDEELDRLPDKYRVPLVLCYLEGMSYTEAARQLGWRDGTLCGRLARARELLRKRLSRRGLTLSGAALAALTESAVAPATTVAAAARMAAVFALGEAAGSRAVSSSVATLAQGVLQAMVVAKVKTVVALVAVFCVLACGGGLAAHWYWTTKELPPEQTEAPPPAKNAEQPLKEPLARSDRYGDPLPKGAIARLGTIRFRHDHASLHLIPSFSRDGKVLATGFNEIRLWDPATGKLLREIRDDYGSTEPFFTPDGRWVIGGRWLGWEASRQAGHDCFMVRLWDAETGRQLHAVSTDGKALACTPDGKQLVTVAKDGMISFWDIATGKRTIQLRGGHKQQVTDLAFTADGKGLVTFCVDHRVCHWDLSNGHLKKSVELMVPRQVHCTCLSPDGLSLAVSPRGQGPVFLLDTTTGKERVQLQGALAQGGWGLAFSPDGKTLATSQANSTSWSDPTKVAFWDSGTGKLLRHFTMPSRAALYLCFTPDGRTLVAAGEQPRLHLWDVATGKQVHNWPGHEGGISALDFTPDGTALVSGGDEGSVRLWDAKTGKHLRQLQGHRWGITGVAVTPDGKTIISCAVDNFIRLESPDGKESRSILLGRPGVVHALGISPDGKTVATFGSKSRVGTVYHIWDLATGKAILERCDPSTVMSSRTFSPDTRLVARIVQGDADGPIATSGGGNVALPPGLTRAVVEDVVSGKEVAALELPKHTGNILRFSADSRSLLTSSFQNERREAAGWHYDNTLHLWELASRKVRKTITWSGRGRFIAAALAPNGRAVATAHDDQTIQLWDLATGKELLRRDGFFSPVRCLAFSSDSRLLASGHNDGTILVWDMEVLARHPEHPKARVGQGRIEERPFVSCRDRYNPEGVDPQK